MIRVDVWLPDPPSVLATGAFGAGALIRIERATSSTGTYAEVDTIAVVSTTVQYTWWDSTGSASSWYRWRVSDSGNTLDSDYSAPFQGTNPAASVSALSYASLGDMLGVFETAPTKPAKLVRLNSLLVTATAQVIEACAHRDYFRHPVSGSATWLVDGDGSDIIHVHEGLVALDTLELSFDGGLTYVPVTATDYVLRGDSPFSAEPIPAGEPYFHIRFTGWGQYANVPSTVRAARLTGARGWPAVPTVLVESTVQRARQLGFASGDYSGSAAGGLDEYGRPASNDRFWPQSLYNFLQAEHSRFMACHVGSTSDRQYTRGYR